MNEKNEQKVAVIFTLIAIISILINLFIIKGYSNENFFDALKDLAQLSVTIIVFIVANRISKRTSSFLDSGKNALIKLQTKYKEDIEGPKANTQKAETEEEKNKRNKFLFLTKNNPTFISKITFIPLNDLEDGILDIRVSKSTIANFYRGNEYKQISEEQLNRLIKELQLNVSNGVKDLLKKRLNEKYYKITEDCPDLFKAIVIDFEERELGFKKFEKIVYECGELALNIIKNYKI